MRLHKAAPNGWNFRYKSDIISPQQFICSVTVKFWLPNAILAEFSLSRRIGISGSLHRNRFLNLKWTVSFRRLESPCSLFHCSTSILRCFLASVSSLRPSNEVYFPTSGDWSGMKIPLRVTCSQAKIVIITAFEVVFLFFRLFANAIYVVKNIVFAARKLNGIRPFRCNKFHTIHPLDELFSVPGCATIRIWWSRFCKWFLKAASKIEFLFTLSIATSHGSAMILTTSRCCTSSGLC